MDMSVTLGILGIIVSIAVGLGTYLLTEKRGRRNRWQAAKEAVLHDLSKSLGEGNVPSPPVILATIRSVLRMQSAPDLEAVTLEEVTDDLLRQITSDPFLDSERRVQLQERVLALKEIRPIEKRGSHTEGREGIRGSLGSAIAGVVASLIAAASLFQIQDALSLLGKKLPNMSFGFWTGLVSVVLTTLAVAVAVWRRRRG